MVLCIVIILGSLVTAQDNITNPESPINEKEETKRRNAVMGSILGGVFGVLVLGGLIFYTWRNFGSRQNRVQVLDSSSGRLSKLLACDW